MFCVLTRRGLGASARCSSPFCKWTKLAGAPHRVNLNAYTLEDGSKIEDT